MKIGWAIEQLAAAERDLAAELRATGARHKADHDVFHLTGTLAGIEEENLAALARHASRYGAEVEPEPQERRTPEVLRSAVEKGSELLGRRPEPGLLLLSDLRALHVLAAGTSLDWVALGQAAQAARDAELLDTVSACHPQTLRTLKWTTYRLKEAAPQALTS